MVARPLSWTFLDNGRHWSANNFYKKVNEMEKFVKPTEAAQSDDLWGYGGDKVYSYKGETDG